MLDLCFALVLCWYLILVVFIIFILHSHGLIANASIIFNTTSIDPSIVRALFTIYLAEALTQTSLNVNEEYTSGTTFIFTYLFVNIHIFFKSPQLYPFSVFNYLLCSFYFFSRFNASHIG